MENEISLRVASLLWYNNWREKHKNGEKNENNQFKQMRKKQALLG